MPSDFGRFPDLDVPDLDVPAEGVAARQALLGTHIATEQSAPARRRLWPSSRAARFAVAGAAASLLFAGTAVAYVAFAPARVPPEEYMRCYTKATLDAPEGFDFHGSSVSAAKPKNGSHKPLKPSDAVESCALLWRMGALTAGSPQGSQGEENGNNPVPPLVACVLPETGTIAVFPGDETTCQRLGIPQLAK